jgi:hypothetical protein
MMHSNIFDSTNENQVAPKPEAPLIDLNNNDPLVRRHRNYSEGIFPSGESFPKEIQSTGFHRADSGNARIETPQRKLEK